MRVLLLLVLLAVTGPLALACESREADKSTAPAPKPSAGTVSSNDKVSDAGADAR